MLRVYSGKCCICDVGMPTGEKDHNGNVLHTGDIVRIFSGEYLGTPHETWSDYGLTVVMASQYQSYSDGSIVEINKNPEPWVMGIKKVGFNSNEWRIVQEVCYHTILDGHKLDCYGISYKQH